MDNIYKLIFAGIIVGGSVLLFKLILALFGPLISLLIVFLLFISIKSIYNYLVD